MRYAVAFEEGSALALAVREIGPAAAPKPRLLDRGREAVRARHYSPPHREDVRRLDGLAYGRRCL